MGYADYFWGSVEPDSVFSYRYLQYITNVVNKNNNTTVDKKAIEIMSTIGHEYREGGEYISNSDHMAW